MMNEGRILPDGTRGFTFGYFLKVGANRKSRQAVVGNHLGNTRVSFAVAGNSPEVIQENHYYPFGMAMHGLNAKEMEQPAEKNKYLYNGKELQDDFGLGWYDYGARFYDVELGRFMSVDPIIENFYYLTPYNYASSNPITFLDYWGLQGIDPNKVTVVFKTGVSDSKVTNYSIQVLQRIGAATGRTNVRVGSTYRSPARQINIMYNQTIEKGSKAQFKLYNSKGDKVIQAQLDATKIKGANASSIKSAMTKAAEDAGFISTHSSSSYENRNAIDITRSDFTKEQLETIKTELPNINPNVKLIDEPDRNCLHFEIPNQKVTFSGGTINSVEINGKGVSKLTPITANITTTPKTSLELKL